MPEPLLIHHLLEHRAATTPEKAALIHDGQEWTYGQINRQANAVAAWLQRSGLETGDRVVLMLTNGPAYAASYYGILKAGAIAVPMATDLKPEGLMARLKPLAARFLITERRFERLLKTLDLKAVGIENMAISAPRQAWRTSGLVVDIWEEITRNTVTKPADAAIGPTDLSTIVFTSGSTGKPKGVMLSHANVVANTLAICQSLDLTCNDVQMAVLPFYYVMGKSLLNTHVAVGGTVVINNRFAYPATVVHQMTEMNVTGFSGVPSTYAYLLHRSPLRDYRDRLPHLRYCSQAGGHMPHSLKTELRKALPDHTAIYIMYGASEASSRLTCLPPDQLEKRIHSIGKPIEGVTLLVVDGSGKPRPNGKTGEIVAQGPNIMQGYWKDDEGTRQVLDENGYHTGDLGYCDAEGYFYLVGRRDNQLKVKGHRVNPQEVEDALAETGLVMDAVVFGLPDPLAGHRLVALIAPKDKICSVDEILPPLAARLPRYKVPTEIRLCRNLPLNASGKVDRKKCCDILQEASPSE